MKSAISIFALLILSIGTFSLKAQYATDEIRAIYKEAQKLAEEDFELCYEFLQEKIRGARTYEQAEFHQMTALIARRNFRYVLAYENFLEALERYRKVGISEDEALVLSNIGLSLDRIGLKTEALQYYWRAYRTLDNARMKASVFSDIAVVHNEIGHKDSSFYYFYRAEGMLLYHGIIDHSLTTLYYKMGNAFLKNHDPGQAIYYANKILALSEEPPERLASANLKTKAFMKEKKLPEALEANLDGLYEYNTNKIDYTNKLKKQFIEANHLRSTLYRNLGRLDSAEHYALVAFNFPEFEDSKDKLAAGEWLVRFYIQQDEYEKAEALGNQLADMIERNNSNEYEIKKRFAQLELSEYIYKKKMDELQQRWENIAWICLFVFIIMISVIVGMMVRLYLPDKQISRFIMHYFY